MTWMLILLWGGLALGAWSLCLAARRGDLLARGPAPSPGLEGEDRAGAPRAGAPRRSSNPPL